MKRIIFSFITITALLVTSCSKEEPAGSEAALSADEQLIAAIQDATERSLVDLDQLPQEAQAILKSSYTETPEDIVDMANGLGYEVYLEDQKKKDSEEVGGRAAYFDLNGRHLGARHHKRDRNKCFRINYPVTIVYRDGSTVNITDAKAMLRAKKACDKPGCFQLVFPVDITLKNGNTATLNSEVELRRAQTACDAKRDVFQCFRYNFPLDIIYADGTTFTINDTRSLLAAKKACTRVNCFSFVYPIDINFHGNRTKTLTSDADLKRAYAACHKKVNSRRGSGSGGSR